MPKTRTFQRSFAGGEISPELFGRIDDARFRLGAATIRNRIVQPQGPLPRRPGFETIAATKDGANKTCRLLEFEFSPDDTRIIELGEGYFRFYDGGVAVQAYSGSPAGWVQNIDLTDYTNGVLRYNDPDPEAEPLIGQAVQLTKTGGTWPAPLEAGVTYYVVNRYGTGNPHRYVQISTTKGGAPISWSGNGIGVTGARIVAAYVAGDIVSWDDNTPVTYTKNYYCYRAHLSDSTLEPGQTAGGPYWYELTGTQLELPNDYLEEDLFAITVFQSADVVTLLHPKYPPMELRRYGATSWAVVPIEFGATLPPPSGVAVTPTVGRRMDIYKLQSFGAGSQIYVRTYTPHELAEGDGVLITGVDQNEVELQDGYYLATEVTASNWGAPVGTQFALKSIDEGVVIVVAIVGTYTEGSGKVRYTPLSIERDNRYLVTAVDGAGIESNRSTIVQAADNVLFVEGSYNTVSWLAVEGAVRYNVYKEQSGLFGYIGQVDNTGAATLSFKDDNIAPDMAIAPPLQDTAISVIESPVTFEPTGNTVQANNHFRVDGDPVWFENPPPDTVTAFQRYFILNASPNEFQIEEVEGSGTPFTFTGSGDATGYYGWFPGAGAYYEGRRTFAGSRRIPQGFWATRSGTEADMRYSLPTRPDDRIGVVISSRQASIIRHVIPMDHLLLLTSAAEYRVTPVNDDALTPTSISVRPQSYIGASRVQPQVVNNSVVFCAARGGHVREMGYQAAAQGFVTGDLSLRAAHLFDSRELLDSAQSKAPHSVLWFVSSSGELLSLSYIPEEAVGAWSWHDSPGATFESVACVAEGGEDRVYVVVQRDGNRYIERMAAMAVDDIADCFYVDAGVTLEDVGAGTQLAGAWLANKSVAILADGQVLANQTADASGNVVLPAKVGGGNWQKVHIGLRYESDLEPPPLALEAEAFARSVQANVTGVALRLYKSGPFRAGPSTDKLVPSNPDGTISGLQTGVVPLNIRGRWREDAQILIRCDDPLPSTIVDMVLEVAVGG